MLVFWGTQDVIRGHGLTPKRQSLHLNWFRVGCDIDPRSEKYTNVSGSLLCCLILYSLELFYRELLPQADCWLESMEHIATPISLCCLAPQTLRGWFHFWKLFCRLSTFTDNLSAESFYFFQMESYLHCKNVILHNFSVTNFPHKMSSGIV